jgi:3'-5' exoribonuclease 1
VKKLCEAGLIDGNVNRNVDYFVVIDFEATCEARNPPEYAHEIIEFPAVLISSTDPVQIIDVFHSYCRPVINPVLSEFCTTLTGIEQRTVDAAETFPEVHARFVKWLTDKHGLGVERSFAVVTDGPFDMGRFLLLQVEQCQMKFPEYARAWINLRKTFANFYKRT